MNLTNEERETIINFNERADSRADVETPCPRLKRQLAKCREDYPNDVEYLGTDAEGFDRYRVPKKWIKIRPPRILTEEQKQEIRDRFNRSKI